jgi:hypothetical protein
VYLNENQKYQKQKTILNAPKLKKLQKKYITNCSYYDFSIVNTFYYYLNTRKKGKKEIRKLIELAFLLR